jgi:predicted AAA+ superfamily ATPase
MLEVFKDKIIDLLRKYCYVGGMPKAVQEYSETQDYQLVRKIQKIILNDYEQIFQNIFRRNKLNVLAYCGTQYHHN